VVARARAEPDTLVLGVDANADGMADAASRAARKPAKGGAPNARFVVCAAEALPGELAACAELVTIQFPWGSLLHGILAGDPTLLAAIVGLLKPIPSVELRLLLSIEPRDGAAGLQVLDQPALQGVARAFEGFGLRAGELRAATPADVVASHSTWAKRLRAGSSERRAWLLRFGVEPSPRRYARHTGRATGPSPRAATTTKE
jgi:16S rRNA (adenine(1408)-N(1))-methyltransferase